MESAATMANELGNWKEVADFYRRASELYNECGRAQPASDALGKGARYVADLFGCIFQNCSGSVICYIKIVDFLSLI